MSSLSKSLPTTSQEVVLEVINKRETGAQSFSAPFKSFSITALSDDVKINGALLPEGMSVDMGTSDNEVIGTDISTEGGDYFITYITKA